MSVNRTTFTKETNEKEHVIIPLLETTPHVNHLINSNEQEQTKEFVEVPLDNNQLKSVTISFRNVSYIIGNEIVSKKNTFQWQMQSFPYWKPMPSKQILTNVSGIFPPGMNAILGRCVLAFHFQCIFQGLFFVHRTYRLWEINSIGYIS